MADEIQTTEADIEQEAISWLRRAPPHPIRYPRLPEPPSYQAEFYSLDQGWVRWINAAHCYGLTNRGKKALKDTPMPETAD